VKKLLILATLCPALAGANPYIEWKQNLKLQNAEAEWPVLNSTVSTSNSYMRIGYTFKNSIYIEAGDNNFETGFKTIFNSLEVKGKLEAVDTKDVTSAELEVRYTFGN